MSEPIAPIRPPHVAVIGEGDPRGPDASRLLEWAEEVGSLLARSGATVVTGGLGGVMRAASRGAAAAGGMTLGILPGADAREANDYVRRESPRGWAWFRNLVVVTAADAVLAVGGRHGTLSKIAWRWRLGTPTVVVYSLVAPRSGASLPRTAHPPRPRSGEAVALALRLAEAGTRAARLARWTSPRCRMV